VTSPYLDQPLLPLSMALPRMLAEIEAELVAALPAEERHLRQRAELLRRLMVTAGAHPSRFDLEQSPAPAALLRRAGGGGAGGI